LKTASWQDVLDYWFGQQEPPIEEIRKKWFTGGDSIDADIRHRFETLHNSLTGGLPSEWTDNPRTILAAIIVIDQFSRNLYRRKAEAFQWDHLAVEWSKQSWEKHLFSDLPDSHKAFSLMPLVHSESLELHELALGYFGDLILENPNTDTILTGFFSSAKEHHDIIVEYGRYPHRNEVLNRPSTTAEIDYLNAKARRFGQ
jgi:uncharacterized protein (DUF924 family)